MEKASSQKPVTPSTSTTECVLTTEKGRWAEDTAVAFLELRAGFRLISRNFRRQFGELDLVGEEMRPDGQVELVFIEVRLRATTGWVSGLESVTGQKRRRLEKTARSFLMSYRGAATLIRFDVLAFDGQNWSHCQSAW